MSYSIETLSEGCYEDTTVLINKFDIKDQKLLDELEQTITSINSAQIEMNVKFENVDFEFYKLLHRLLFEDIYEWAGSIRRVNMSKKGTSFCDCRDIERQGALIFKRLKNMNYLVNLEYNDFIDEVTDLHCTLNMLHPFREGNGRTHRLFLTLLIRNAGYYINFSEIDVECLMIATIKSALGYISLLRSVLKEGIKK